MTVYAPRVPAHSTRTGVKRTTPILYLVVHTSEGGETLPAAEQLAAYIATPRTADNLASYHYIADTDRVIPVVPDNYIAYAAGGGNANGLHICHPGKANQTAEQWGDANSADQLEQVAQWLAEKATQYDIPLRHISPGELQAGKKGVCGHVDITNAFHKTTHTDPGSGYPWPTVIARANAIAAPPAKPKPPPVVFDPPTPSEEDTVFVGFWNCAPDDTVYAVYSDSTKRWMYSQAVWEWAAKLAALGGKATDLHTTTDHDLFMALGPVIGPNRKGCDDWGIQVGAH